MLQHSLKHLSILLRFLFLLPGHKGDISRCQQHVQNSGNYWKFNNQNFLNLEITTRNDIYLNSCKIK